MNLKEQKYICVIAETGNITRAAEKLYISQSALSMYVNNLESILDIKLFDRAGKRFVLTEAGRLYVDKAKKMLALQEEFNAELASMKAGITGSIIIGVQLRRATGLLPPVMSSFRKEYPHIQVILLEGVREDLEAALYHDEIDILIDNLEDVRSDLIAVPLFQDVPLIALPECHNLISLASSPNYKHYPHFDLSRFRDEFFILPSKRQSLRYLIDRCFKSAKIFSPKFMEVRNIETVMQLVAEGYGIGFNREQYAKNMKAERICYGTFTAEKSEIYALRKNGKTLQAYSERFIEMLKEQGYIIANS